MRLDELETILEQTLEDGRLSRAERRALAALFEGLDLSPSARAGYLNRAFRVAEGALDRLSDREVLDWLLALSKSVARAGVHARTAEVLFEPRDDCGGRLAELIDAAGRSVRVCVFTVTDDRVSRRLLRAHERGVQVRLISDDDKSHDPGSDVERLARAGVAVRLDQLPDHMHHKFAVFDDQVAVTGSYNWTRGAAERNHENLLITDDPRLVVPYVDEFERLWQRFER